MFVSGCAESLLLPGIPLAAESGGSSLVMCMGFSLRWLVSLWPTGSRVHGLQ